MLKTEEYIANRLKWRSGKHGLPSQYAVFFDGLSSDVKKYYSDLMGELEIGIPVLVLTQPDSDKWTIIGTKKLCWGGSNKIESLLIENIKGMTPRVWEEPSQSEKTAERFLKKTELNELIVTNLSEEEFIVPANKGGDFFAMWNILLVLCRLRLGN